MKRLIIFTSIFLISISCLAQEKRFRIISLAPSITEILFELGLDKEIVGVTSFCNWPLKAKAKEKIGSFSQPNIEKIVSLKPDIIFATGLEQATTVMKLRRLKLNVYVSDPTNIKELFQSISEMGKLIDRQIEANMLIKKMEMKVKDISSKVAQINQTDWPKIFIEIWDDPLMTAGKGSFVDELISLAGGQNIAYDVPRPYSYFSHEKVIKRNPDYIILGYMVKDKSKNEFKKRLGWQNITAVRNNRIFNDIDPDLLLRPGPRLVLGLEELYKHIHNKK